MNKILLFLALVSLALAAEKQTAVELNIAKIEYGAVSDTKKLIDDDVNTFEQIESFVVKLATETKLDKIDMKIKPARGTLVFKSKVGNKEKYITEIDVTENDEYVSFSLKEDKEEYRIIIVTWIPSETGKKLDVKEFGAYTSEKEMVALYKQVAKYIVEKKAPEGKISDVSGEETVITERNMILPKTLPTEYVISPARLPETRPVSR